ncbi:MAG: hypothetical protein HY861_00100 [Chlamydiia bacterium]|nr:hypothetical protein [Chlamydiia bacterium]
MNALGFVFSLLTILAFGAFASLSKQVGAQRLRASYLGHLQANQRILEQCESAFYNSLPHIPRPTEHPYSHPLDAVYADSVPPPPLVNPNCARIDLSLLLMEEVHTPHVLYDAVLKILKNFYGGMKAVDERQFLDILLATIRRSLVEEEFVSLEKLSFPDPDLQFIYYKMLKGTKKSDSSRGVGYPSFLDYFKIESGHSKVCLLHAHPTLLSALLTPEAAERLYQEIHTTKTQTVTQEVMRQICQETQSPPLPAELFSYLELSRSPHKREINTTFLGEDLDTQVLLRKTIRERSF